MAHHHFFEMLKKCGGILPVYTRSRHALVEDLGGDVKMKSCISNN
jgi:hypothetical protein